MKCYFKILSIAFFALFIIFSCGNKNKVEKEVKSADRSTFSINLPDSVNIDSLLTGHVEYEETPNPVPGEEIYKKYTFLYATISKTRISSFNDLIKVPHDTFVPIDESIIPIYDLELQTKGNMLFQGFIVDQFLYKKSKDSMRIVNHDRKVSYPIKVY